MRKKSGQMGRLNWATCCLSGILLLTAAACQPKNQARQAVETPTPVASPVEEGIVADNATLQKQNEKGQPMWKINAGKATYFKEKKYVRLEKVTGNLYQDGKAILQIQAKTGEIEDDGKKIVLREQIVAVDPRNQAVLKTEELEWRPEESVAIARKKLTATNANIKASATEGRYISRSQQLELSGKIEAIAKEPAVQLRGEKAVWQIPEKKITSDRPLEIERYQEKTVSDRLVANKGQWDLATQVATVQGNVELKSLNPKMQIASNAAVWDLKTRAVQTSQPLQVVNHQEGFSVTGNQGSIDLERQVVRLQGGAQGINLRKQANLYANQLVWQISKQLLQAEGNVVYDQSDPPLHLTGPRATGNLETQQISVASETNGQVVTEITP